MRKLLLATSALITLVAAPALAADMSLPAKAPYMPPPPVFSWTGFYIGGNIGAIWSNFSAFDTLTGASLSTGGTDGFIGGGQVVYCGPVLRHPAELMLPAVDLGGRVWLGGKPCKGGPMAPAFGG